MRRLMTGVMFVALATVASAQTDPEYVLGPEDVVVVNVLRHPEFSDEYLIPSSGVVQIKPVGDVKATGMSLATLQEHVRFKLRDRLRNPEVSVALRLARMKRVYLFGDLKSPGVFDLKEGWGVAECLSAAGGLAQGIQSRDCKVILERAKGESPKPLSLTEALDGSARGEYKLQPGDVLRVESIPTFPVYVTGKVKTPGMYRLREDSTGILEAIAQAGGVLDGAAVASVRIIRITGGEEEVNLTSSLTRETLVDPAPANLPLPKLNGGDIVLVPESLDRFAILGHVTKPGFYPIPSGRRYSLSEAVAVAEGAAARGRLSQVGLVRMEGGKEVRRVYDLGKYLKKGDKSQNPEVLPGDVLFIPESNRVDITTVLTGISTSALFFNAIRR